MEYTQTPDFNKILKLCYNNNNTEDLKRAHIHPAGCSRPRIQKHRGKSLLFHDKCPGFLYVHYTTHGTYSFTSHPKDEAIMVIQCLCSRTQAPRPARLGFVPTFWQHQNESNALDRSATAKQSRVHQTHSFGGCDKSLLQVTTRYHLLNIYTTQCYQKSITYNEVCQPPVIHTTALYSKCAHAQRALLRVSLLLPGLPWGIMR